MRVRAGRENERTGRGIQRRSFIKGAASAVVGVTIGSHAIGQQTSKSRSQTSGTSLALVGAKIYPSPFEKPILSGDVLIHGTKIVAVGQHGRVKVPARAQVLDVSGLTLVSGFQNSHVHFTESKWADSVRLPPAQLAKQFEEMLTRYGFTTVVDTASFIQNTIALRDQLRAAKSPALGSSQLEKRSIQRTESLSMSVTPCLQRN